MSQAKGLSWLSLRTHTSVPLIANNLQQNGKKEGSFLATAPCCPSPATLALYPKAQPWLNASIMAY